VFLIYYRIYYYSLECLDISKSISYHLKNLSFLGVIYQPIVKPFEV